MLPLVRINIIDKLPGFTWNILYTYMYNYMYSEKYTYRGIEMHYVKKKIFISFYDIHKKLS